MINMKKIIHKYILKNGLICYICNQAINANWLKTDITNKKINCKNCLNIIKKEKDLINKIRKGDKK